MRNMRLRGLIVFIACCERSVSLSVQRGAAVPSAMSRKDDTVKSAKLWYDWHQAKEQLAEAQDDFADRKHDRDEAVESLAKAHPRVQCGSKLSLRTSAGQRYEYHRAAAGFTNIFADGKQIISGGGADNGAPNVVVIEQNGQQQLVYQSSYDFLGNPESANARFVSEIAAVPDRYIVVVMLSGPAMKKLNSETILALHQLGSTVDGASAPQDYALIGQKGNHHPGVSLAENFGSDVDEKTVPLPCFSASPQKPDVIALAAAGADVGLATKLYSMSQHTPAWKIELSATDAEAKQLLKLDKMEEAAQHAQLAFESHQAVLKASEVEVPLANTTS